MSNRIAISAELKCKVMYDSAFACAVCQKKGDHIHHLDKNNSNNVYDNLVLLCQSHHDEAHTKRELSLNLTADHLRKFRDQWYLRVKKHRNEVASASGQSGIADEFFRVGIMWGYINHSRLIQALPAGLIARADQGLSSRLQRNGVLDQRGIMIKPKGVVPAGSYVGSTVYDWYSYPDSIALHIFYSE